MSARDEAELVGGAALAEHYKDNPWQTFHHEPSVAAVVIDALIDRPDLLRRLAAQEGAFYVYGFLPVTGDPPITVSKYRIYDNDRTVYLPDAGSPPSAALDADQNSDGKVADV